MTTDEMCLEAIKRGYVTVDLMNGLAYAKRFAGKRMGSYDTKGYQVTTLSIDGEKKQVKLHRLLWIAENGLLPTGSQIDHINRNKADNRISNLRLADSKLNSNNRRSYDGIFNPSAKINKSIANLIRMGYETVKSYSKLAKRYRVSKSLVAQIIRGELWN